MSSPRVEALAAHPLPWTWKDGLELEIRDGNGELVAVVRGKPAHQFALCHVIASAVNQHQALCALGEPARALVAYVGDDVTASNPLWRQCGPIFDQLRAALGAMDGNR